DRVPTRPPVEAKVQLSIEDLVDRPGRSARGKMRLMRIAFVGIRNILKAWSLLVGGCLVFAGLGYLAGGLRLLSVLIFCCLLLAAATYWYVDRVALGMLGARELLVGEAPPLHSAVERLAAVAGMPKPKLYLLPGAHPRALATGRGPRAGAIAVSSGLLAICTPAELEGVIAHELAHIRHRDVLVTTAVVVTALTIVEASRIGGFLQR